MFMNVLLSERGSGLARLFLRIAAGILMLSHGISKIEHFSSLSSLFPDPLGWGSGVSLVLMILVEVGCSVLLMVGLMTRLAVLPLIFGMGVAAFYTHPVITLSHVELPLLYLVLYVGIFLLGPGKCSIDYLLKKAYSEREDRPQPIDPEETSEEPSAETEPYDPFHPEA